MKNATLSKLQSVLDFALRGSSSSAADPFKDDLTVVLHGSNLTDWLVKVNKVDGAMGGANEGQDALGNGLMDNTNQDNPNLRASEAFTFDYRVRFPLNLVISKKTVVRYQLVFRYLLQLKLLERLLADAWTDQTKTSIWRERSKYPEIEKWKGRIFALRARMFAFVQQMFGFAVGEVLEPNWRTLEGKLKEVETVDQLLRDHVGFLDDCLNSLLLTTSEKILKALLIATKTADAAGAWSPSLFEKQWDALDNPCRCRPPKMRSTTTLLLALFTLARLANGQVTSVPVKFGLDFSWSTNWDNTMRIPQCSEVDFDINTAYNAFSGAAPVGPFKVWVIFGNNIKRYVTPTATFPQNTSITLGIAVGTSFSFYMEDVNGYSGGIAGGYTVTPGSSSCTQYPTTASISVSTTPSSDVCGPMTVSVSGGTSPYYYFLADADPSVGITAGPTGSIASNTFIVDPTKLITSGHTFDFWIEDSNGYSSNNLQLLDSSGSSACTTSTPAPTAATSPPPTSIISPPTATTYTTATIGTTTVTYAVFSSASRITTASSSGSTPIPTGSVSFYPPASLAVGKTYSITPVGGYQPYVVSIFQAGSTSSLFTSTPFVGSYPLTIASIAGENVYIKVTDARQGSYRSLSFIVGGNFGSPKKSFPIAAVVGGVVGGLFILGALAVLLFLCCRRRRRPTPTPQQNLEAPATPYDGSKIASPYVGDGQSIPYQGNFPEVAEADNSKRPFSGVLGNQNGVPYNGNFTAPPYQGNFVPATPTPESDIGKLPLDANPAPQAGQYNIQTRQNEGDIRSSVGKDLVASPSVTDSVMRREAEPVMRRENDI
ncbi:hypothetical protein P7C70_g8417, partial [Phenoliferia sp. Uapishka_3]